MNKEMTFLDAILTYNDIPHEINHLDTNTYGKDVYQIVVYSSWLTINSNYIADAVSYNTSAGNRNGLIEVLSDTYPPEYNQYTMDVISNLKAKEAAEILIYAYNEKKRET